MERREPDFEDERIRQWRARPQDEPIDREDPTMLGVGEKEEIFESRVYQIRPQFLAGIVLKAAEEEPEIAIAALLVAGSEDATFRMMAKRSKDDGRVTFIVVGVLAGNRTLLAREDGVEEQRFREFVQGFEGGAFSRGFASEPSVVTLDQWRTYDPRNPGGADSP